MSAPTNNWKLGFFVALGMGVVFTALVALGANSFDREKVRTVTYFDETVQGLEIGSPLKFRGVRVGEVVGIGVAPDHELIQISMDCDVATLKSLGLAELMKQAVSGGLAASKLRIQLASAGITGVKFLQADLFADADHHPPLKLTFPAPKGYIPSTGSSLKSLEESVVHTAERLPELLKKVDSILTQLDAFVLDLNKSGLPAQVASVTSRVSTTLSHADTALKSVTPLVNRVQAKDGLLARLESAAARLDDQLAALDLAKTMNGANASIAATGSAARSVGELASHMQESTEDLDQTLRSVDAAARSIDRLAEALERDPDMLLKGRAIREEE